MALMIKVFVLAILLSGPVFGAPLTQDQRDILAHIVVDPDTWQSRNETCVSCGGTAKQRLQEKLLKWKPIYEAKKAERGTDYKNRAARDLAAIVPSVPTLTNAELVARETKRPVFGALLKVLAAKFGVTEKSIHEAIRDEMAQ